MQSSYIIVYRKNKRSKCKNLIEFGVGKEELEKKFRKESNFELVDVIGPERFINGKRGFSHFMVSFLLIALTNILVAVIFKGEFKDAYVLVQNLFNELAILVKYAFFCVVFIIDVIMCQAILKTFRIRYEHPSFFHPNKNDYYL